MSRWAMSNRTILSEIKQKLESCPENKIWLSFCFKFPRSKLRLKLSQKPKKLDTSNRIKPIEDMVCKLLDFDDSWVFKLDCEKVEFEKEQVDCSIYVYD